MNSIAKLRKLYFVDSKHSNYQVLSARLASKMGARHMKINSRYERERLEYIFKNISIKEKTLVDIGGNTGFFTFESLEAGAENVHCYEGNNEHALFLKEAAKVLQYSEKVKVFNEYYSFNSKSKLKYDVTFLLNVLHHFGDDFGDESLSVHDAKKQMALQLNSMASKTDLLVFQLGFCWKGRRDLALFEQGTKRELIDFVVDSVEGNWVINSIGVPEKRGGSIQYVDLNDTNILRDDALGEFLNRPIFIMSSNC